MSLSTSLGSPDASVPASPQSAEARRGVYRIAHRAGNNLHALEDALSVGVDAIECDFWHARGRLALRHERKLPGIPVYYDKWFLRWQWGELSLRDLLRQINHRAALFLDIKSSTPRAADSVLELYADHESMMPTTLVCSKQWKLLDRLAAAGTDMQMFYSIGRFGSVDSLLRRIDGGRRPAGTSIRHTLLSDVAVRQLHDAGLRVFAWTVNNRNRAEELISWGVDGLISDELEILRMAPPVAGVGPATTSGSGGPTSP